MCSCARLSFKKTVPSTYSSDRAQAARPPRSAVLIPFVALQSFSQSLCDEKGVAGLLQAPDLAVSDCPEMGESGLHLPPLLRNAEIASENVKKSKTPAIPR